ncbi:hypothetical protein BC827DRAFT_872672 [Russula dissimulans]|nr:hypothetical protein BC827DRAFT_872672 [Russula dissimulans]
MLPTFYDPDLDWAASVEQQHLAHSSSYSLQSSTASPPYERQTQLTARHPEQYQFVQQHPPPAPDPTQFASFNPLQEHDTSSPSTSDTTFLDSLIYTPMSDSLRTPRSVTTVSPDGSSIVCPSPGGGDRASPSQANIQQPHPNRLPGACTYCKRLKMKCYFPPGENVCKRCRSGKHDCIVEGGKPRGAPSKREYLLARMKQKDELIDLLLKQLHNPYLASTLSIGSRPTAM